jgi:SMI1-KNR4 cell-wall
MEIIAYETGEASAVDALEKRLNVTLPDDYKEFLKSSNGAKIIDGYFYVRELEQEILMDVLYGINLKTRTLNLDFWHQEYGDEIPSDSLLIGGDPGGGFILLINDLKNNGIYYYDHSYFFDQSSDENNTYLISRTFSLFLEMLEGK